MKKITIDFRNCVSEEEIRGLLIQNLNLSEWDEKKPDNLLRALKEIEKCEIYLVGTNLIPGNLSVYMKKVIDTLEGIEEKYDNIIVMTMNVITIDFTGCKHRDEIHFKLKEKLDFPDWYGQNLSALWDLLTGYIAPCEIHLTGLNNVSGELIPSVQKIVKIFQRAEAEYNHHKIIIE